MKHSRQASWKRFGVVIACVLLLANTINAIQLTTRATSRLTAADLYDFIARPIHWPQIVASSDRVVSQDPEKTLRPGVLVQEYFGLGLLFVEWTCRQSQPGRLLVVESPDGVPGIAKDCSMRFDFQDNEVTLTMGYQPVSPLAVLATPVLMIDNWIALNVLLPAAVDHHPLKSFRKLMGVLYGVAGVLHAADLWLGDSVLFTSNGMPVFGDLPPQGQVMATLWCAIGPLAWWSTRQSSSKLNDAGLILYGLVEMTGAKLSGLGDVFASAVMVQVVVLAAWVYSFQKELSKGS